MYIEDKNTFLIIRSTALLNQRDKIMFRSFVSFISLSADRFRSEYNIKSPLYDLIVHLILKTVVTLDQLTEGLFSEVVDDIVVVSRHLGSATAICIFMEGSEETFFLSTVSRLVPL